MTKRQERILRILADPVNRAGDGVVHLDLADKRAIQAAIDGLAASRAECERLRGALKSIATGCCHCNDAERCYPCIAEAFLESALATPSADAADFARRLAAAGQDLASIERLLAGSLADRLMAWPGGPATCIEASVGG